MPSTLNVRGAERSSDRNLSRTEEFAIVKDESVECFGLKYARIPTRTCEIKIAEEPVGLLDGLFC
jgi:hypothetical protein